MENKERGRQSSPVLHKVLVLLGDLKTSSSGAIIHGHIEQMLSEMVADHHRTEEAYASFLDMLLEACVTLIPVDSSLYTHLRLVQLRLAPPLSASELGVLNRALETLADELVQSGSVCGRDLVQALSPVLERFGRPQQQMSAPVKHPGTEHHPPSIHSGEDIAEFRANTAYRAHLDKKREEMQQLQQNFVAQMSEVVTESKAFGHLLEETLNAMQKADCIEDLEVSRRALMGTLGDMIGGHRVLDEKFTRAQEYLSLIEDDNQQLSDELDRVRLLSLTDELTGLPNRRAFMRRLEDEVSRVQRHGYPLGVVLIDLDHFKRINDLHGHAAGDEVLRSYAREILSIFRHHDLVARYGGEEFAVLLPNTIQQGVAQALEKVRRRLAEVEAAQEPDATPLTTFSAGVAEFRHGESSESLIKRADSALYAAKHKGRNRTEISGAEPDWGAQAPNT